MAQYELNLRDYLRILRRRKWIILISVVLCTLVSPFFVSQPPVVYQARTTVKIEERKTIAGLLTEALVYNPADIMTSEANIIKGFPVIKKVAQHLGLLEKDASLEKTQDVVASLQRLVTVKPIQATNIIEIMVAGEEPKKAMELANTIATTYIEEDLEIKQKQSKTVRKFIEAQLAAIERRLDQNEESLKKFGDQIRVTQVDSTLKNKLSALELELIGLSQKYTDKHPNIRQLKEQIKDLRDQVKSPQARADRDKLSQLNRKRQELLEKYTENHPAVQEINEQIKDLENQLASSDYELEYARLTLEAEVNRKLYAMLKEKLEETRITEAQQISSVSVVDPAMILPAARAPKKDLSVLLGMVLGLVLGTGLAFIRENLDTSIGTVEDVENVTRLPVIGVIPSMKGVFKREKDAQKRERMMRLLSHYKPRSPVAEAYRNIQTNLKIGPQRKTILVTSAGAREGKSTVAINLAIVMAQAGLKTLLLSADLRRPVVAKTFGLKKEPGLTELIIGTAKIEDVVNNIIDVLLGEIGFEEAIKAPGLDNIWITPSGHLHAQPVELLESKEFTDVLERLKSRFEVIILDSPPILPVTDASILARKTDCVMIVYEIGRTSRGALMRTKIQLESVGAKIVGVLINNTNPQIEPIASYNYYRQYQYYGKEKIDEHAGKSTS
ncbi:MAG: hypothetical protein AMJ95_11960 [Omnitrophica WOR_2 bacterium SM23_72]|nr:MAG: hypothetical protein AMJ95_11960 [Omnitrophica WOR_2 bacterium SM23_72]